MTQGQCLNIVTISGRIPELDGLRAVGVILVLVHHFLTPINFGGAIGVDIFFVLSGYLITLILMRELVSAGEIRLGRFYIKRLIRLYPPLILVIVALVLPAWVVASDHVRLAAETLFAALYLTPLALEFANGSSVVWRHTWTLGLEELFYLVWPVILLLVMRMRLKQWTMSLVALGLGLVFLAAYLVVDGMDLDHGSILFRAGGLLIGCGLALLPVQIARALKLKPVAYTGFALLFSAVFLETVTHSETLSVVSACIGTALVLPHLVSGASMSMTKRILASRSFVFVGAISYELYLWHYPILVVLSQASNARFIDVAWLALPVTILTAVVAHALVQPISRKLKLVLESRA